MTDHLCISIEILPYPPTEANSIMCVKDSEFLTMSAHIFRKKSNTCIKMYRVPVSRLYTQRTGKYHKSVACIGTRSDYNAGNGRVIFLSTLCVMYLSYGSFVIMFALQEIFFMKMCMMFLCPWNSGQYPCMPLQWW